jgi:hypothetical protein
MGQIRKSIYLILPNLIDWTNVTTSVAWAWASAVYILVPNSDWLNPHVPRTVHEKRVSSKKAQIIRSRPLDRDDFHTSNTASGEQCLYVINLYQVQSTLPSGDFFTFLLGRFSYLFEILNSDLSYI